MKARWIHLCCLLAVAACGKSTPVPKPVTASEKAAFLMEIIEHRAECKSFRDRLSQSGLDMQTVDKLYQQAVSSRCIEKDV